MWVRALCLVALVAAVTADAAWPARANPVPRTVLSLPAPLGAFAADGGRMAWMTADERCGDLVRTRAIAGGPVTTLTSPNGQTCRAHALDPLVGADDLVLAGTRALWTVDSSAVDGSSEQDLADVTLGVPGRPDRALARIAWWGDLGDHDVPEVPVAGAGSMLVYADDGDVTAHGELYRVVSKACCRVGRIDGVHAVAVDGGRIAVARTTPAGLPVTWEPDWSSNGRIAFTSWRDSSPGIFTFSPSGGAWQLVAEFADSNVDGPAWSPDGRRIAYTRGDAELWVMDANGGGKRRVAIGAHSPVEPRWSPDGRRLVWTDLKEGTIWTTEVATGASDRLVAMGSDLLLGAAPSPDGKQLAYADDTTGRLYDSRLGGTAGRPLWPGKDPARSPDATRIAFVSSATCGLSTIRPDGTGEADVTTPPEGMCDSHPSWSPDGARLVFSRGTNAHADLYVVNVDGTGLRRLTTIVPARAMHEVLVVDAAGKAAGAVMRVPADEIALSGSTVALLRPDSIQIRDVRSGRLLRTILPPPGEDLGGDRMSLSGHRLVYDTGDSIRLVDTGTGRSTILATYAPPDQELAGLAISGRTVVWAVSGLRTAQVRELTLP